MTAYVIERKVVDPIFWQPLVPPIGCNTLRIQQTDGINDFYITTNRSDPTAVLAVGPQEVYEVSGLPFHDQPVFDQNSTAVWVKAESGTGPLTVEWIR